MTRRSYSASVAVTLSVLAGPFASALDEPSDAAHDRAARHFTLRVLPVLLERCAGCHGSDSEDLAGNLDVRSRETLLAGGESGEPAIVPGRPEASPLLRAVRREAGVRAMPPKETDRLDEREIADLEEWVHHGAPWPDDDERQRIVEHERTVVENDDGVLVRTSGGLFDAWTYRRYAPEDVWAFRAVRRPALPDASVHPIDAFIEARLAELGIAPAPEAPPDVLLRRLSYDLTGLPPSEDERARFVDEWNRDPEAAWRSLIDRLLTSPHYGERSAQHWLDVARYADTGGYSNDFERSNAWRYRDWVVRAFNEDMPWDRFVIEQLAGDELADASVRERVGGDETAVHAARLAGDYTEEESAWIVATGFLRMGPWDNAMVKSPEARQIWLDDVVHSVGQSFLSLSLRCSKCHDHKFDPVPTRDYYRLYAAFSGTQMAERPVPFLGAESRAGFEDGEALVTRLLEYARDRKEEILSKQEDAAHAWYAERGLAYVPLAERQSLPDEAKPPRHVGLTVADEGRLKVREQDEWIWERRLERYRPMAQSVYDGADIDYAWDGARKLRIAEVARSEWRPNSRILLGGSLVAFGDEVTPGVPSATPLPSPTGTVDDPWALPGSLDGRRLTLARWIADERNPLSNRSIVNRVWQHHFGVGLARNVNSFGAKGAKPTHPDLLDWLTSEFLDSGRRLKSLHRLIVTSHAYRRSTAHPRSDDLRELDPENRLLAVHSRRRLTAEEIRDSVLAVTGELDRSIGGLPARPEIHREVALEPRMIQFSLAPAYQPSRTPAERHRRTLYAYRVRGQADPFLELFGRPSPNDSCEERDAATVTPQALSLLQGEMMIDRSIAFALRVERERQSLEDRVKRAFDLALGREPDEVETSRCIRYVRDMVSHHESTLPERQPYPTTVERSLVEEFSGEPFSYEEILPAHEDFVSDPKPWDVSPGTRALADLCLLLFNSSEFLHVE